MLYPRCSPLAHLLPVPPSFSLPPLCPSPSPLGGELLLPYYLILAYQVWILFLCGLLRPPCQRLMISEQVTKFMPETALAPLTRNPYGD